MYAFLTNDEIARRLQQFRQLSTLESFEHAGVVICRETVQDSDIELIDKDILKGFWSTSENSLETIGTRLAREFLIWKEGKLIVVVPTDEAYSNPEQAAALHARKVVDSLRPHILAAFASQEGWVPNAYAKQLGTEQLEELMAGQSQLLTACANAFENDPTRTRIVVAHARVWTDTTDYPQGVPFTRSITF